MPLRPTIKSLLAVLALGLFLLGAAAGYVLYELGRRGPLVENHEVWIKKGDSIKSIASHLQEEGVIDHPWAFRLAVYVKRVKIKAGEYQMPPGISIFGLTDLFAKGKPLLRKISIPEGWTNTEIRSLINESPFLSGDLPELTEPEGSFLPETYLFERGEEKAALLMRMADDMQKTLEELWKNRNPALPLNNLNELVTLASIVEKETSVEGERSRIAAVFYNRLARGMKLQTDPSVIYALTKGKGKLDRPLTRKDLLLEDPYNTYLYPGLPPGPIANPGLASLKAVLEPVKTDELYFVADGSGGHAFAKSLEEHNRNVAKWRKLQKSVTP